MKRSASCSRIPKDTRNLKEGVRRNREAVRRRVSVLWAPGQRMKCGHFELTPSEGVCPETEKIHQKFKVLEIHPLMLGTPSIRKLPPPGRGNHAELYQRESKNILIFNGARGIR